MTFETKNVFIGVDVCVCVSMCVCLGAHQPSNLCKVELLEYDDLLRTEKLVEGDDYQKLVNFPLEWKVCFLLLYVCE